MTMFVNRDVIDKKLLVKQKQIKKRKNKNV